MWPGSGPPTGPRPAWRGQEGPPRARERPVTPGAGWYALPALLLLVATAGCAAVFALLWDESRIAHGPAVTGDPVSGLRVQLADGHGYFLYVRAGRSSPFACSVELQGRSGHIQLTRQNSWSAAERPAFRYTATFVSPVTGAAVLRCGGTEGPLLVVPDDTVNDYLGFVLRAAAGLALSAAAAFAVIAVRRGGARRRAAARVRT
ncbi:hypothetical protein E1200_07415 [Actinomadura sp. GC306]|uniref:hypothetical protein n=1 Tax=Actinomadura sp. GC306 TaxID=2530367 RepID=UPI00104F9F0C|nr:hypothetical protein [Actinomadura sp. GC306]TDC69759.1 hypothetical protein E1200_07415 [Actinomadura sp. GC306]